MTNSQKSYDSLMVGTKRCKLWQIKADSYFDRSNDSLCDHGQVVQFSCTLVNKTIKLLQDKKQKVPRFYWKTNPSSELSWWINDKNNKTKHGCNPQLCQIYHKNMERVQRKRRQREKKISKNTKMPQSTWNQINSNNFNKREYRCPQGGE